MERGLDLAFRDRKALCNVHNGVAVPVAPDENAALFFAERGEEGVQRLHKLALPGAAGRVVRRGDALLQLRAELTKLRAAL